MSTLFPVTIYLVRWLSGSIYLTDFINTSIAHCSYKFCSQLGGKMYQKEFLPLLIYHLRICDLFKCIPFEYEEKSERFAKSKSIKVIRFFKLQCILTAVHCTALFLNICFGPLTKAERLQGLSIMICSLAAAIPSWNYSIDIAPIQIINAFLDFDARIIKSKRSLF